MDQSEFQKSQLPNTSLDDSPFLNLKTSRLRKKKTQSKLTYLKQVSIKKKKSDTLKKDENEDNTRCETKSKENSLQTIHGESPSSADTINENASGKKEENVVRACPVCWKRFENAGDQMQHMKTCASKHNLTLKQLLDAVDLQTKQLEERKTLGLPCVPATGIPRKSTSKKNSSVSDKNDPDLQLGLALSVSMQESEEQNNLVEQEIMLEAGLGGEVAANQASLLERFGFTSTRPVLPSIYPRARPGKTKLKGTPLLLIRTQDERERLITEKVAIILTSEENKLHPPSNGDNEPSVKTSLQSETLAELQTEECCLWQKASASPSPKDCDLYYVGTLSHIISPSTVKAGSKLKHLSQVPCRLKSPERFVPTTVEDISLNLVGKRSEIMAVFSQNSLSQQINEEECSMSVCNWSESREKKINTSDPAYSNIQEKSNLFVSRFVGDWNNMLNNSSMSDIKIWVQDSEEIYVHELVLFVRCPNILLDVKQTNDSKKYIVWDKISFKCAFAFLDFIYCGSTSKINDLKYCVDEILFLSTKYCVEDLCSYLKCILNEDKDYGIVKCQDLNGIISDGNSKVVKPYYTDLNEILSCNLVSPCKSDVKRSIVPENKVAKREEKHIESNYESSYRAKAIFSPERSDSLHESCLSPDPFVDSCDNEIITTPCTRKSLSPNTQQNMDNLLEALNVDGDDGEFHQTDVRCSSKIGSELSDTYGFVQESPEVEIIEEDRDDIYNASTIKKRKLSNYCNSVDVKQICTNDRNSVRKSLLSSFSGGENSLLSEGDKAKINRSPKICNDNSLNSVESIGKVSVKSSDSEGAEEMNVSSKEVFKEVDKIIYPSPNDDVLTVECSPSTSSEKLNDAEDKVADTSRDLLGDFCADYDYQNYCANYSPCNEEILLHSKYNEKSVENPVLVKQQFFEAEEMGRSPFSSPLSVKSLSKGDSPFSRKNGSSRKKVAWTRTRSSSDISVNNVFSHSPISVKCLSQSSIHLKSSHDPNTDKNKVQTVSDPESGGLKKGITSGLKVQSPVTPSTHVRSTPNRSSLNSVKRLLEDSFTAELERNLMEKKLDCESWPCSTPNSTQSKKHIFSKHLQSVKDGENCVTPMADYSGMDTPMLKRELQKYGLKPLKRKRAKQILRHIYNELHPLVPVESSDDRSDPVSSAVDGVLPLSCSEKQAKKMPTPKKSKKKNNIAKDAAAINSSEEADISSENEVSLPSTQESSSSSQCEFEVLEDPAEDGALTQIDVSELPGVVLNYIRENPEFHQQVLLYEPIWLEQLQEGLKAQNYKFKLTQLMEYLDEECITFRTIQGNKTKERQRKKKSK